MRELLAAQHIASKDETRYALCGVHIEIGKDKFPILVATDGRRLLAIRGQELQVPLLGEDYEKKAGITLSRAFIAALAKMTKTARVEITVDEHEVRADFVVDRNCVNLRMMRADALIEEHPFPGWRNVLPSGPAPHSKFAEGSIVQLAYRAEYLADMNIVRKLLGLSQNTGVCLTVTGEFEPVIITFDKHDHVFMVLMPLRLDYKDKDFGWLFPKPEPPPAADVPKPETATPPTTTPSNEAAPEQKEQSQA